MAIGAGSSTRVRRVLTRWWRAWRRQAQDEPLPADPAVHALAEAVLARADVGSAPAAARGDMSRMMRHFGIEPAEVPPQFWDRLRSAEHSCTQCASIGRCQRWSYRQSTTDAPRLFCPNAELFDEIAASQGIERQQDDHDPSKN
jgi:Family of unknown function (DUF6455)